MRPQASTNSLSTRQKIWFRILTVIAIAVLLYFRPFPEQSTGPRSESGSQVDVTYRDDDRSGPTESGSDKPRDQTTRSADDSQTGETTGPDSTRTTRTSEESSRQDPIESAARRNPSVAPKDESSTASKSASSTPSLREVDRDVYESAAGLRYRSGSADGHRLKHVMEHAVDNPDKVIHGVFEKSDQNSVVALIDEAYMKTRVSGNRDVRQKRQGDRTVYTVHLDRRVGYVGGREGSRKGHPECRYIRIVLEDENSVVTAYPMNSF